MDKKVQNLARLFNPQTIAVVGASNREGSVGNSVMKNLIGKFEGIVYPVNPRRKSILGIRTYPTINDIPDNIDLVIVATPAQTVPALVEECGEKKVGGMVIITAGFKEAGDEGKRLFEQVKKLGKKYNVRIIGPNCLGFLKPDLKLNASFANKMALPGKVAFISQSGALCTAVLDWSVQYNVGFSHFISLGSMADVGFECLLNYFENDSETEAVIMYMESLTNSSWFLQKAAEFSKKKPIIAMKVGKSTAGAKAALSHTGSLAGNDEVFNTAFERAGIIRINESQEMYNIAQVLARQPFPEGKNLAIITNAGGPGVIATDSLIENAGKVAELSKNTIKKLNEVLPPHWSHGNPVDVLGDADPERYKKAVNLCLKDKNVDGALVVLTPQSMTKPMEIAKGLIEIYKRHPKKPVYGVWMGEEDVELGRKSLEKGDIPVFKVPESGVRVFMAMYNYTRIKEKLNQEKKQSYKPHENKRKNKAIITRALKEGRNSLTEFEAKKFMANYNLPVTAFERAENATQAANLSSKIGFPVVMKILSSDIIHKTEVGGVISDIKDEKQAQNAFGKIITAAKKKAPKAKVQGVLIEKQASKKHELLIGSKYDPLFGPTIVFGKGGVTVELEKDTAIELPPLNNKKARELIEKTKIFQLLKGYRGMKGVSIKNLENVLCNFSQLLCDFPELREVDINPFAVDEKGGVVLDAKVVIEKTDKKAPGHLAML
ncbi:MAG: acetate--CoA ligase alpha subunit [Nanoarchaeota archaeon]